jgi:putative phosphonate catabolism associated alcohol dehydrogenase
VNHPSEALTVVFHADGARLELRNGAVPRPAVGEILLRTDFATLCRSDLLTYTGKRKEKDPTILGHEFTGRIVDFGGDSPLVDLRGKPLAVGDRITAAIFAADPGTDMSQRGMPQKSADLFKYGHECYTEACGHHGGLSEYILLRRHTPVVILQEGCLSDPLASILNCAVATVAAAMRCAGSLAGRKVLVTGAGMLGLVACAMAHADGADCVHTVDLSSDRIARSFDFGANRAWATDDGWVDRIRSTWSQSYPYDIVLDFTGSPEVMSAGIDLLGIGGTAVWVGATYPQPAVPLLAEHIVRRILTIRGIHNYNATDLLRAVDFMEAHHHHYPFAVLVDGAFPLSDVVAAFEFALKHNPYRAGIRISNTD